MDTQTGAMAGLAVLVRAAMERDGEVLWLARGRSMRPAIHHGQTVRIVSPTPRAIRTGAIAMATLPGGQLVVHRIVRCFAGGRLKLRGDACRRSDPTVHHHDVIGIAEPSRQWSLRSRLRLVL
jgi:hypothetical protein